MSVLSKIKTRWTGNFEFRLIIGFSGLVILLMTVVAVFIISRQNTMLQQAAEARALAFSQTFASIGAAAVFDNLFRIQESMEHYLNDPTIINIDVVDEDNLIVSSRNTDRIGLVLTDSSWLAVTASEQEAIITIEGPDGEQALLLTNPLFDQGEILAWVRIEVSLAQMQQEQRLVMWQIGLLTLMLVSLLVGALRLALRKFSRVLEGVHGPLAQALTLLGGDQLRHADPVGDDEGSPLESSGGTLEEMDAIVSETTTLLRTQSESIRELMTSLEHTVGERTAMFKTAQARFQAVVEQAAEGIITVDEYGSIQSFNPAASHLFGYAPEEILGQNVNMLMPSPDHEQHDTYLLPYPQTGEEKVIGTAREVVGRRKDGATFPIDLLLSEMMVDGQRLFTSLIRDITDRKETEAHLAQARDAALEAASLKSEFLATMSHEIRTPLNGVIGMTGLLLDTELTADQRDCAEIVRSSGEALATIINDILDFSKIEAGKLDLEVIDLDLRSAVEEVLDLLAESAAAKHLELVGLVYSTVPTALRGDPGRLRQILINFVGNAIKFTKQGEVVVQVTHLEETGDKVRVRVDITDTGVGISRKAQPRLFQSFSQADSSMARNFGGTGLGLAICKQLVEMMNGEIGVDSELGKGSLFWFTVLLDKQEKPLQVPPPRQNMKNIRVCIVDDNGTNRTLLQHYADHWGMRYVSVGSGSEALTLLQAAKERGEPYDLVIVDQEMPGMDGLELTRRIKAQSDFASVRVVTLTSLGQRGYVKQAKEAGISGYLPKPVRRDHLYRCLTRVMGMTGPEQEGPEAHEHPMISLHTMKEKEARQRIRILVAEDNMVNQKVAVQMLGKLGYHADVVTNGKEAVEALCRIPYDVILMDCQMPEMDGYEATREIRRREALRLKGKAEDREDGEASSERGNTSSVSIIAMTANAMKGDREKCLGCGMNDFVSKPVKIEELDAVLEQWVPKRGDENPEASLGGTAIQAANDEAQDAPLDAATLDGLRELGGDGPTFLAEVIQQFLTDGPGHVTAIRQAVMDADASNLQKAAHAFKGSCRIMGALSLGELCWTLEQKGMAGTADNLEILLTELEQGYSRTQLALEAELAGLPAGSV
ncbi:MAG: response regulator [Nitrospirales bacterium]